MSGEALCAKPEEPRGCAANADAKRTAERQRASGIPTDAGADTEQPRAGAGLVADIQRTSVHDGPGIRTTIFFKGCPLHCAWCHNPECISFAPQELFYREKCIGCGKCAQGCYAGARVQCGRRMTSAQVLADAEADRPYYGETGGVTFSGGEPLAQRDFLASCVRACREAGIRTAIETSLIYFDAELLRGMQVVMADLKLWDDAAHRKWTGVSNEPIKTNFRALDALGVPIIVRTPVIPGVNADTENIAAIAHFAAGLRHAVQYELLPYHPLGNAKRAALGQPEPDFAVPDADLMKELNTYANLR